MKLVEVEWHDAYELGDWSDDEDIDEWLSRYPKGLLSKSIGYVLKENDDIIFICQTYQPEEPLNIGEVSHVMVIPKVSVKNILIVKDE